MTLSSSSDPIMPHSQHDFLMQDGHILAIRQTSSRCRNSNGRYIASSSSSSSSIDVNHHSRSLSSLRLDRILCTGHRAGPSTPTLSWNMLGNHVDDTLEHRLRGGRHITFSARKLAASLWDLQEIGLLEQQQLHKDRKNTSTVLHNQSPQRDLSPAVSCVSHKSRRRSSIQNNKVDDSAEAAGPRFQVIGEPYTGARIRQFTDASYGNSKQASAGENGCGSTASSGLVRVLNQISSLQEKNTCSIHMVSALRVEINRAREQVQELLHEQKWYSKEVEKLTKGLTDEKMMWLEEEQANVREALWSIKEELEAERKSKRRLERLYRKAGEELTEVKATLAKAWQDLRKERRARELMEVACDELAREAGEDKARAEELMCESAEVREQVEEERKMLQMAEQWREERVQMKLAEARLELEEKNTTLDKLRSELQTFLRAKRASDTRNGRAFLVKDFERNRSSVDSTPPNQARIKAWKSTDLSNLLETRVLGGSSVESHPMTVDSVQLNEARVTTWNLSDSAHLQEIRVHDWSSDDSVCVKKSTAKIQIVQEPDSNDSTIEDDIEQTLEIHVKDTQCNTWYNSQHATSKGTSSTGGRLFAFDGEQKHRGGKAQGLEKTSNSQFRGEFINMNGLCLPNETIEKGEVTSWIHEEKRLVNVKEDNIQQSDKEGLQKYITFTARTSGRYGDGCGILNRSSEFITDAQQPLNGASSPTHSWSRYCSSAGKPSSSCYS